MCYGDVQQSQYPTSPPVHLMSSRMGKLETEAQLEETKDSPYESSEHSSDNSPQSCVKPPRVVEQEQDEWDEDEGKGTACNGWSMHAKKRRKRLLQKRCHAKQPPSCTVQGNLDLPTSQPSCQSWKHLVAERDAAVLRVEEMRKAFLKRESEQKQRMIAAVEEAEQASSEEKTMLEDQVEDLSRQLEEMEQWAEETAAAGHAELGQELSQMEEFVEALVRAREREVAEPERGQAGEPEMKELRAWFSKCVEDRRWSTVFLTELYCYHMARKDPWEVNCILSMARNIKQDKEKRKMLTSIAQGLML